MRKTKSEKILEFFFEKFGESGKDVLYRACKSGLFNPTTIKKELIKNPELAEIHNIIDTSSISRVILSLGEEPVSIVVRKRKPKSVVEKDKEVKLVFGNDSGTVIRHLSNGGLNVEQIVSELTRVSSEVGNSVKFNRGYVENKVKENSIEVSNKKKEREETISKIENFYSEELKGVIDYKHNSKLMNITEVADEIGEETGLKDLITPGFIRYNAKRLGVTMREFNRSENMSIRNKNNWKNPEYREHMSKTMKKLWDSERREKQSNLSKELWKSEEHRRNISEKIRISWKENPDRRIATSKTSSETIQRRKKETDFSSIMSEISKKAWENPEFREEASKRAKNQWKDPKFIEKIKASSKKQWSNEEFKEKMRIVSSNTLKKQWKDPNFREKMYEVFRKTRDRITTPERIVMEILECEGVSYKYNSHISDSDRVVIPDFLVGKKVIEVQGSYYHADPRFFSYENLSELQKKNILNDVEKAKFYARNGYSVLYLWEKEIKKETEEVRSKILEFL